MAMRPILSVYWWCHQYILYVYKSILFKLYIFSMYSTLYVSYKAQRCCFLNWKKEKLHTIWFNLYDILKNAKERQREKDQQLPGAGIGAGSEDKGEWGDLEGGGNLVVFLPETQNPSLNMRKTSDKPNLGNILLSTGTPQNCQGHQNKGGARLRNCPRPEETKEAQQRNTIWYPEWDSATEKGHWWKN